MEYNTIFAKSFSRYEQKKLGFGAFLGALVIFVTIVTVFRPSFDHLPILNIRGVTMRSGLAILMFEDAINPPRSGNANNTDLEINADPPIVLQPDDRLQSTNDQKTEQVTVKDDEDRKDEMRIIAGGELKQEGEGKQEPDPDAGNKFEQEAEIKQETEPSSEGELKKEGEVNLEASPVLEGEVRKEREVKLGGNLGLEGELKKDGEIKQETKQVEESKLEKENGIKLTTEAVAGEEAKQESEIKQEIENAETGVQQETTQFAETKFEPKIEQVEVLKETKPVCNIQEPRSDYCNLDREVRIHGSSSTIYFASSKTEILGRTETYKLRPYARKGDNTAMSQVTELSVKPFLVTEETPLCTTKHSVPVVVFSTGGYAGNNFHDYADILVPLFVTSRQFNGEVQFVVTNIKNWWLGKYKNYFASLSRYEIIDMDNSNEVHCFPTAIVGTYQNFTDLRVHPWDTPGGYSMSDFRKFMRDSYSLKRNKAIKIKEHQKRKPRLLLIARKNTRSFTNEGEIVIMAKSLGFSVIVAEPGVSGLAKFAELVNSCDVMMGVHGAGLTNLVFLPTKAILIQIAPFGNLFWLCEHYFGEPARDMGLRYLDYTITEEESTLSQKYPHNHPVLRDPASIHKQGWLIMKATYLTQSVKLDVNRFKPTLIKALELLHH
ncbi:hypothetical protein ACHQM5_011252 [Ranunculus cassubicifolius]